MEIKVKVRPITITANTKAGLVTRIMDIRYQYMRGHFGSNNKDNMVVWNLEKRRTKTKQIKNFEVKKITKKMNIRKTENPNGTYRSEVMTEAHWVGYVYVFNKAVLDAARLGTKQNTRNFEFFKKNK